MRRWRGALVLLCAVAEEALDIPGVEVVRVAPLPPAAPSPEAAAYAATLVNVSIELQLAGGALVALVSSAAIATFWTPFAAIFVDGQCSRFVCT